jgi:hypothetical protein
MYLGTLGCAIANPRLSGLVQSLVRFRKRAEKLA